MARIVQTPDAGNYNRPAQIQIPAPRVDDGQGGNSAAGDWNTVRSPMVHVFNGKFGRGLSRAYQYGQLYPTASDWAEMRYANDVEIDGTMTLLVDGDRFQILGAIDQDRMHVITVLALVLYQAKGSK
ncbi:hypothetical protein ccbrp13_56410 [Ktedonobacteria bacterium brp13]|nr:hypothetical protein ccbrp13_56410 [Ktedonobacteria bacterium brp13]